MRSSTQRAALAAVLSLVAGVQAANLVSIQVEGPAQVAAESTTLYRAYAKFDNGVQYEVTLTAALAVTPGQYAGIDALGFLSAYAVAEDRTVVLSATLTWGSVTRTATKTVTVLAPPPVACNSAAFQRALSVGGAGQDLADSVALDSAGNVYLAGVFTGTADLDPTSGIAAFTAVSGSDVYLTCVSSTGQYRWTRVWGSAGNDECAGVAAVGGAVAIAGNFTGAIDLDPTAGVDARASAGQRDGFVVRLSTAGTYVWGRTLGAGGDDHIEDVALDGAGNTLLAGGFQGTVDFDPSTGVDSHMSHGSDDIFAWKLTAAGGHAWAYTVGNLQREEAYGIAVAPSGAVYLTGRFRTGFDFDPGDGTDLIIAVGATDAFVTALNADGTYRWTDTFGGNSTDVGSDIVVTPAGNVIVCGSFWETVDFDPGPDALLVTSVGEGDAFVVSLDDGGGLLWARAFGGPDSDDAFSVAAVGGSQVLVGGTFYQTVDFDPGNVIATRTSAGDADGFLLELDATGAFGWVLSVGGAAIDTIEAVAGAANGAMVAAGAFEDVVDLDPTSGTALTAAIGASDVFAVMLQCDAATGPTPFNCLAPEHAWARAAGGTGDERVGDLAIGPDGMRWIVGSFYGSADFDPTSGVDVRTSAGDSDIFLTALLPDGSYGGTVTLGGSGADAGNGVAVSQDGFVIITGAFSSGADFDPGPGVATLAATGGTDAFVLVLDSTLAYVWAERVGGNGNDVGNGIAVDSANNLYIAGAFQLSVDFDPGPGVHTRISRGDSEIFLLRLAADGTFHWVYTAGNSQKDEARAVAVQGDAVYVAGWFRTGFDFDPSANVDLIISQGASDGFVTKFTRAGNYVWTRALGGPSTDIINDVAVTLEGDVLVAGSYWDTVDFNPTTGVDLRTAIGQGDGFVTRLAASGAYVWTRTFGGTYTDEARGVSVDPVDNVMVAGTFVGTVDFDPGPGQDVLVAAGGGDACVVKYDAQGEYVWAASMGGSGADAANAVATELSGAIVTGGVFSANADFNPGTGKDTKTSVGGLDMFCCQWQCGTGLAALCPGDCDCSGDVSFNDINPFVASLAGRDAWLASLDMGEPDCAYANCDANQSGRIDLSDILTLIDLFGTTCP